MWLHLKSMKRWILLLSFCHGMASAQISPAIISGFRAEQLTKREWTDEENITAIPCPFGKPYLSGTQADKLRNVQILSVELVYTRFRRSENFNQKELNRKRLENLRRILPQAFENAGTEWKITEQTGAETHPEARDYFHGFLITYRPLISSMKERNAEIDDLLSGIESDKAEDKPGAGSGTGTSPRNKEKTYDSDPVKFYDSGPAFGSDPCDLNRDVSQHVIYPKSALDRKIAGRVEVQFTVNKSGGVQDIRFIQSIGGGCEDAVKTYLKEMPLWKPAKSKNTPVNAYVTLVFEFRTEPVTEEDENCSLLTVLPPGMKGRDAGALKKETGVSTVLNRQNWNNIAVVCDVTGSMGPYLRDLMSWFRMNEKRIKHFTFFNDGDMTPDARKQVGATGGIYHIGAISSDAVEKELEKAMRAGFGGDIPENDVEALSEAEQQSPFSERLVWIADNYAVPRDKALLPKVKKPISIILCTKGNDLNTEYLKIARTAGASLHTLTGDLPDLSKLKEGESFFWNEREYKLQNGKFERVY